MECKLKTQKLDPWILISLILAGTLVVSLIANTRGVKLFRSGIVNTKPVFAAEIYPLFTCPCCGKPLDKNNICCEQARERINYIDSQVSEGKTEKEITLAYVKKYGLNSFADQNKAKEMKEELVKAAPADRPIITLNPQTYDFGDVSQKKGKVYTDFALKNEGKSDLVIKRMDTSCGCTFAAIVFEGKESPYLTMPGHGYENPQWDGVTIPVGKTAKVKVMYDPDIHKDFRGPATREISIYSNDPVDFEKKVQVELNQVD